MKGVKGFQLGHKYFGLEHRVMSMETRMKMSIARKGRKISEEQKMAISKANKGKKMSDETKLKMSLHQRGENGNNWKGGKQRSRHKGDYKYSLWRKSVFERDNYTCQVCFIKGGSLIAHHILGWSKYPEFRYLLNNGQTLCVKHHKETENYGGKKC